MIELQDVYSWHNRYITDQPAFKSDKITDLSESVSDTMFIKYGRFLGVSASCLIDRMKDSLKNRNFPETRKFICLLEEVIQSSSKSLEIAEVSLECAYALTQMGDYQKSVRLFHQTITHYGTENLHNRAVALWMLGDVYWQIKKLSDAFNSWERSYDIFRFLSKGDTDNAWYTRICAEMRESIVDRSNS